MVPKRSRRRPTTKNTPKRRFPRLGTDGASVAVREGLGRAGHEGFVAASLVNLSPTGACVELDGELKVRSRDNVTLRMRVEGTELELPAQVAWVELTRAGQRIGLALHLERALSTARTQYARWIVSEIQKQQSAS